MSHAAREAPDPTIYPVEDEVGEHEIQNYILEILRPLLERYLNERGVLAHVGSDQFIYWVKHDPTRCVAPDIYVLPGVPQSVLIDVWKVWERGSVPSFALEVVGRDMGKDYLEAPKRYAELGTKELVIYDPFSGRGRLPFHVYRRAGRAFRRAEQSRGDRVRSQELGCFVRVVGAGDQARLRLGVGPRGDKLFPTAEEAALSEAEAERAAKEAERAAKEAERAAKEAALSRVAALEAELKKR